MAVLYSIPDMASQPEAYSPVDLGTEIEDIIVEEITGLGFAISELASVPKLLFEEIGLDSMDMINLVVALEDRLDIEISVSTRIDCGSVKDLIAAIARQHA